MNELHMDTEFRSEIDITERGLDNVLRHPSTELLMLSWAINDQKVHLWEPRLGPMPAELHEAIEDPWVVKKAWNVPVERGMLKTQCDMWVPYPEWSDVMVHARHLSMPGSLSDVSKVMGLKADEAKDAEGKRLIDLFCLPAVPASEGGLFGSAPASFRNWETDPKDWALFCDYCKQDTVAERANDRRLAKYPFPDSEQALWVLDQIINDVGMPVDMDLVRGARIVTLAEMTKLREELRDLTHLENSNSTDQMLAWVRDEGYPFNSLGKGFVKRAFEGEGSLTPLGRRVLELRAQTSKSSVHKFIAIANNVADDGRIRGQFVFGGASRTQRWSARALQPQNFPRPTPEVEKKMDRAVELLRSGDYETICKEFSNPLEVVTSCIRPAIKAPEGSRFMPCDLSAIENRVLGWLSGCKPILDVFFKGLDPYKSFGAKMFNKPYDEITKDERQISKPAVLGAGYQLSGGELVEDEETGDVTRSGLWGYAQAMGVEMTQEQAHLSIKVFREEYSEVVQFWKDIEGAAISCVKSREDTTCGLLSFHMLDKDCLQMMLPSGRAINYLQPKLDMKENEFGGKTYKKLSLSYGGQNQKTKQWARIDTYSGKLTENAVQAIARDILAHGMMLAHDKGFEIVGHVHDEIIPTVPYTSHLTKKDMEDCMSAVPSWAVGLPLAAVAEETVFYKK